MIKFISVKSTNIDAIAYDAAKREMHVRFIGGTTHAYADVPAIEYGRLLTATSKGSHFAQHVRDKFKSRRVGAS